MIVADKETECLQYDHGLLMSLLSDHFIKQLIPAVPKYLPHRLLHLLLPLTSTVIILILLSYISGFILLFSQLCLRFLLSLSIMVSFNGGVLLNTVSLYWVVEILGRD